MKILMITMGSRGDVQPFVALGVGLKAAGHDVTLCACESFKEFTIGYGLNYAYMNDEPVRFAKEAEARKAFEKGKMFDRDLIKKFKPMMRRMLDEIWLAAQGMEAVVFHPKAMAGGDLMEKLNIPGFMAIPLPLGVSTREFPVILFPNLNLGPFLNKFTHQILTLMRLPLLGIQNKWRQEVLGLPPRSVWRTDLSKADGSPVPVMYCYSKHVGPWPKDWPENVKVTGYWFLDRHTEWTPPEDLKEFFESGEAPIYIGFGSIAGTDPKKTADIVLEALRGAGQRGLIASGWGGMKVETLPDNVFMIDKAPHDWLFPRCTAVVHHGGAGSVAAGLRAGKPTLVCPFFGDQPFWGKRVFELGLGPAPIPQKKLSVKALTKAFETIATDQQIRQRAAEVAEKISSENGVANAVEFIQSRLGSQ